LTIILIITRKERFFWSI